MRAVIHWSTRKKKPLQKRTSPWQEVPLPPRVLCGRLCSGFSTQLGAGRGILENRRPRHMVSRSKVLLLSTLPAYSAISRYRNVTIWARVQGAAGANVVALVPLVTPSATAHWTAAA